MQNKDAKYSHHLKWSGRFSTFRLSTCRKFLEGCASDKGEGLYLDTSPQISWSWCQGRVHGWKSFRGAFSSENTVMIQHGGASAGNVFPSQGPHRLFKASANQKNPIVTFLIYPFIASIRKLENTEPIVTNPSQIRKLDFSCRIYYLTWQLCNLGLTVLYR